MNQNSRQSQSLIFFINKLKFWISYLNSKIRIILIIGSLGGLIGLSNTYFKPSNYKAVIRFNLENDQSTNALSGALGLASKLGIDVGNVGGGIFKGNNLIELIKSRMLIQKALTRNLQIPNSKFVNLAEMYVDLYGLKSNNVFNAINLKTLSDTSAFSFSENRLLESIYTSLIKSHLKIISDENSSIINLECVSTNENFSKLLVENVIAELSAFYKDIKTQKAVNNVLILQKQVDSIRLALNNSILDVASANDKIYNLNQALNIKRVQSSKIQIDVQGNSAIYIELVKNLELAKMNVRNETPLLLIIDKPILPLSPIIVNPILVFSIGFFVASFLTSVILIIRKIIFDAMNTTY
jgi:uncharacterized protein involved in exopolysaccharide biosynthesis